MASSLMSVVRPEVRMRARFTLIFLPGQHRFAGLDPLHDDSGGGRHLEDEAADERAVPGVDVARAQTSLAK